MLLDTSGLYLLLDASEQRHDAARRLLEKASPLFTHSYILAELIPLGTVRGLPRKALLAFVSTLLETGEIEVAWVGRELHEHAHHLLLNRVDKTYSLCDAVSFVLMKQRGERKALTTDHHFDQEGFLRFP